MSDAARAHGSLLLLLWVRDTSCNVLPLPRLPHRGYLFDLAPILSGFASLLPTLYFIPSEEACSEKKTFQIKPNKPYFFPSIAR